MKHIARFVLYAIPFFIPRFSVGFDTGNYLAVVGFLFAILAGFFIAAATSNYLRLQSLISTENALLITIARLARKIQPKQYPAVARKIDSYLISILDHDLLDYANRTEKEFSLLIDGIDGVRTRTPEGLALLGELHAAKKELINDHSESAITTKRVVGPLHWLIVILLAVLTSALTLSLRGGDWASWAAAAVLVIGVFEVLELIYYVDSNAILADKLAYQSPQPVFATIGRLPYYPEPAITNHWVKRLPKKYRMGRYIDKPHSLRKKIVVVKT